MNNTILAIDLGKYKCVACFLDQNTGEFRFTTFDTSRAELLKIIAKESPNVVVIEACLLAGWVHDLCGEHGVRCLVANTASEAWKYELRGCSRTGLSPLIHPCGTKLPT